ncbi:MAG: carboxymuconolactone decarboxylase family protein [Acidimicrobiales bacterium]
MNETLARELEPDWVSAEELDGNYRPVLRMVRELIGVIPNCNPILEIWPPGFRTFNLLVPNLLNLPSAVVGQGAPKDLVGIAMYASSNAAGCPYCTAHHCSFAIRRGADPDAVLGARSPAEAAVADLAEAMAVVPHRVTPAHVAAIEQHLSDQDIEWIVLAVSLGGFLNKFMDAMGIQLEDETIADVQALLRPTGWNPGKHLWSSEFVDGQLEQEGRQLGSADTGWAEVDRSDDIPLDGLGTYLRVFRQAPGAARLEKGWTRGVSGRLGPVLLMLEEEIGYAFPILAALRSQKAVKAIATALRDNLDEGQSRVGLRAKLLAGLVYAGEIESELLSGELMLLIDALVPDADPRLLAATKRFAAAPTTLSEMPEGLDHRDAAALLLAKAASPSPAEVSEITVATVCPALDADEVVELVVWLALLQTLGRLYSFFDAKLPADPVGHAESVDADPAPAGWNRSAADCILRREMV